MAIGIHISGLDRLASGAGALLASLIRATRRCHFLPFSEAMTRRRNFHIGCVITAGAVIISIPTNLGTGWCLRFVMDIVVTKGIQRFCFFQAAPTTRIFDITRCCTGRFFPIDIGIRPVMPSFFHLGFAARTFFPVLAIALLPFPQFMSKDTEFCTAFIADDPRGTCGRPGTAMGCPIGCPRIFACLADAAAAMLLISDRHVRHIESSIIAAGVTIDSSRCRTRCHRHYSQHHTAYEQDT